MCADVAATSTSSLENSILNENESALTTNLFGFLKADIMVATRACREVSGNLKWISCMLGFEHTTLTPTPGSGPGDSGDKTKLWSIIDIRTKGLGFFKSFES